MSGRLYMVATPIGNMEDITLRALRILSEVDFIACEDTRVSQKLLKRHNISKPLLSYHEHNSAYMGENIVSRLESGQNCALISDAGTPIISDPGAGLARLCLERGITVEPIPGPCALAAALSATAIPSGRFCFEGFLTVKASARRQHIESLKAEKRPMIFYEAPHKLIATLEDLLRALGDRELMIARELTKLHEEITHTTISAALEGYRAAKPKGEFVLIVAGAEDNPAEVLPEDIAAALEGDPKTRLTRLKALGLPRNEAYRLMLEKNREQG